ncbi:histidine phosphatase family protein, partial [bacterium]|nr:histidine phosphatase family protein [bacterium]
RAAAWLSSHVQTPLGLVYSPAARTARTAEIIAQHIPLSTQSSLDGIYDASVAQLLQTLEQAPGDTVLVGHNPGLESLLAFLCTGQSGSFRGMSPGSIAWLSLPGGELTPGLAKLQHFFSP